MDWNIVEGEWKELKGHARKEWGKLTDDELEEIGGKKDILVGKLQQKYGYASDEAHRRADEWAKQMKGHPLRLPHGAAQWQLRPVLGLLGLPPLCRGMCPL